MDERRLQALAAASASQLSAKDLVRLTTEFGEAGRWAAEQCALRDRARAKFADADSMLFVREALEQASHERVAAYHASRFPVGVRVADLTAGIGADLRALSARGPAVGFEIDPERAECARWNCPKAEVVAADSMAAEWDWEYAWADPSRRVAGRRTADPASFAPDPVELTRRMARLRLGGIKLTPLMADPALESLGQGLEFVSFGGECREAVVWLGDEAMAGREAVHLESGERLPAGPPVASTPAPGAWLFDADPATVRAHCLGVLGMRHGLVGLGDSNGYLTGPCPVDSVWLRPYRVLWTGPADLKTTRAALRNLKASVFEVKQRGAGIDVERLRRDLRSEGRPVSLVVWPVGKSLRHALVEAVVP